MPKYPVWFVGLSQSAANFALGLPDIYVKASAESITADATLSDDAELAGIPLAVGTHWVKCIYFVTAASATPDVKTGWAFTGTWSNPVRGCLGPGSANTGAATAVTDVTMRGYPANSAANYGLPSSGAYNLIHEEAFNVTVTVAGNFSVQWAQNTSDAAAVVMREGSAVLTKQIA